MHIKNNCACHLYSRYPTSLAYSYAVELSQSEGVFSWYQLMEESDIPEHVWESALIVDGETCYQRMDTICTYLKSKRDPDGTFDFERLAQVALLVLTLPHSNAEEERSLPTSHEGSASEGTISQNKTLPPYVPRGVSR